MDIFDVKHYCTETDNKMYVHNSLYII